MILAGISAREFARRDGCTHTLVNRKIKSGHLALLQDGSLDPQLVGTGWREENRRNGNPAVSAVTTASKLSTGPAARPKAVPVANPLLEIGETPEAAAERIVRASGPTMSMVEAERTKENYLALLRQLEYDVKSGAVVPVSDVAKEVGAQFAQVRTRLTAIPAECAPRLHRLKSVAEMQDALMSIIVEALEGLSREPVTVH